LKDENGDWIISHVFNQDFTSWIAQGDVLDRSLEMLGDSDRGVIMFRRQLQQQMRTVEEGGDPINVFRDPKRNECVKLPLERVLTHITGEMLEQQKNAITAARSFEAGESPALEDIRKVLASWEQSDWPWAGLAVG
jgi:hypothetical protein